MARSKKTASRRHWTTVEVLPHHWQLVPPETVRLTWDTLEALYEVYEVGGPADAGPLLETFVSDLPEHMDAIGLLAEIRQLRGDAAGALALREQAVALGREALGEAFEPGRDRLEWLWLDNRPYLRTLCALADSYEAGARWQDAAAIYETLQAMNPNDNVGARCRVVRAYLEMDEPERTLAHCEAWPEDGTPEIVFGRGLALAMLGKADEARSAIGAATEAFPKVAAELLKTDHPPPADLRPGLITWQGEDQAWVYWDQYGAFWAGCPEAIRLLREAAG